MVARKSPQGNLNVVLHNTLQTLLGLNFVQTAAPLCASRGRYDHFSKEAVGNRQEFEWQLRQILIIFCRIKVSNYLQIY